MLRLGITTHRQMRRPHYTSLDCMVKITRRRFKAHLANRKISFCIVNLVISICQNWQSSHLPFSTFNIYLQGWLDLLSSLNLALNKTAPLRLGQSHFRLLFVYWRSGSSMVTLMKFRVNLKKVLKGSTSKSGLKLSHNSSQELTLRMKLLEERWLTC